MHLEQGSYQEQPSENQGQEPELQVLTPLPEHEIQETYAYTPCDATYETCDPNQALPASESILPDYLESVVELYRQGYTKDQIAEMLSIKKLSVTTYLGDAASKLGIDGYHNLIQTGTTYSVTLPTSPQERRASEESAEEPAEMAASITLLDNRTTVQIGPQQIELSSSEFSLFEALLQSPQGISKKDLAQMLGLGTHGYQSALSSIQHRLEKKLSAHPSMADIITSVGKNEYLRLATNIPPEAQTDTPDIATLGDVKINTASGEVLGQKNTLTGKELTLFKLFFKNKGTLVTHENIIEDLTDNKNEGDFDPKLLVSRLRSKLKLIGLKNFLIRKEYGKGYVFEINENPDL